MDILPLFTVPERTKAGYGFADTPVRISFKEANVAVYGVPDKHPIEEDAREMLRHLVLVPAASGGLDDDV